MNLRLFSNNIDITSNTSQTLDVNFNSEKEINLYENAEHKYILYKIDHETGYALKAERWETKYLKLQLLNKQGDVLNSVLLNYVESAVIVDIKLDIENKKLIFIYSDETKQECDISSLFDTITEITLREIKPVKDALNAEIEDRKAAEEGILNLLNTKVVPRRLNDISILPEDISEQDCKNAYFYVDNNGSDSKISILGITNIIQKQIPKQITTIEQGIESKDNFIFTVKE